MNRRNALKTLSISAGGALIIPGTLFSSCQSNDYQPIFFPESFLLLINEIGETILPETEDSPGAKSLHIANFIDLYVGECYSPENQEIVLNGIKTFEAKCKEEHNSIFQKLDAKVKHNLLVKLDQEAQESISPHYFSLIKSLVLFGYFTSQEGANKALRYLPIPGKYDGNYPFENGDKAWAL